MHQIVVRAATEGDGLWTPDGQPIPVEELPLSDRVVVALADWVSFYADVDGRFEDAGVEEEFISQGYKIAHGIRRELKGSSVWLHRIDSGQRIAIERRHPR